VLGIGDSDFGALRDDLRCVLSYYMQTPMACYRHDGTIDEDAYDAIRGAVAEMSDTFGHIDCVESFNEWWLPLDARLRADFGAEGLTSGELAYLNRKSLMKKCFIAAGIDVMPGKLVENLKDSEAFLKASSNDIIVKPDWGVGASDTRRIRSVAELKEFFASRRHGVEYFMEQFVGSKGRELLSFDGLADKDGDIVFYACHTYSDGIMDVVAGSPLSYYNYRHAEIPQLILDAGRAAVKSFAVRKRFFHIEFFRLGDRLIGLEMNARPPGVLTLDMVNHEQGIDCWDLYAQVCLNMKPAVKPSRDFICTYAGRLNIINYTYSHDEIMAKAGERVVFHMPMDSKVMGDYTYLLLAQNHDERRKLFSLVDSRC